MPAYKDEQRKTWYCSFYYTDFQGNQKRKVKRGFAKKKDAEEYERNFLVQQQQTSDISFETLCTHYLNDCKVRLKPTSYNTKTNLVENHFKPYFAKFALTEITPLTIRNWQNSIIQQGYKPSYQRNLHQNLSAIFNYAVNFFGLKENPCKKAGSIGKSKPEEFEFWTVEDFNQFISLTQKEYVKVMVTALFWTGLRIGELLALTPADISNDSISITKTYKFLNGKHIIQSPKTENSVRTVSVPKSLIDYIRDFADKAGVQGNNRIFEYNNATLGREIDKVCEKHNLKRIRVHDLRHSHASYLINKGFSPIAIKDRLGHDKIETTLQTYSHLYASTKEDIISFISNDIKL